MEHDPLKIAGGLLALPTAPFHEERVLAHIECLLTAHRIPFARDPHGNLIARYDRGDGPLWALVAHTDHPGIEVTSVRGDTVHGTFLGGVRPDRLEGARVRLHAPPDKPDHGPAGAHITRIRMVRGEKRVTLRLDPDHTAAVGGFGDFDLGTPRINSRRIAAVAIDDLIGCATTLAVLVRLKRERRRARVWGVFTRAEEVGFAGTQKLVAERGLPGDALVVSLESSMELPGARPGQGPVIRVGDRATSFDSDLDRRLHRTARQIARSDNGFKFQRQLMSGGTCEASVFAAAGYRTTGLAYPLLNYHNMPTDTARGGIAAEEIATSDFLGGIRLLFEAVRHPEAPEAENARYLERLARSTGKYIRRL
ncbi:MAG: M20/M25/M40 family metallo-hydrolase [Leptospirillia bacterium]